MSKKDNLLKFWESLESDQQSKDIVKPYRLHSQSNILPSLLKTKSISHGDLLSTRLITVPSRVQLQGWRGENKEGVAIKGLQVDDAKKYEELEVSPLPFLPRNDLLTHQTKSRVRRIRKPPTRQKKLLKQVASVKSTTSVDEKMPKNSHQTPPAAQDEFSRCKFSPTSARFLDKPSHTSAFSTFMEKPKIQSSKTVKRESLPAVPQRNRTSSSKFPPEHKANVETESLPQVVGSVVTINLPDNELQQTGNHKSQTSEETSRPVAPSKSIFTPSKALIAERRASFQAVTIPIKSETVNLQAFIRTHNTPQTVSLQAVASTPVVRALNLQAVTSTPVVRALNLQADRSTPVVKMVNLQASPSPTITTTDNLPTSHTKAGAAVNTSTAVTVFTSTIMSPLPVVSATAGVQASCEETNTTSRDGKTALGITGVRGVVAAGIEMLDSSALQITNLRKEFDKKLKNLESDLAKEKNARVKLEDEVEALQLIVTKLSLST